MGTAIPVTQQLIENGRVIRPRIGVRIQDVTPVNAAELGLTVDEGVLIVSLAEDGPAERVGLQVDDVIVQVDQTPVSSTTELVRLFLTAYSVGDTVSVTVVRSAVHLTFDITLKELL
jgi:S1-C subfamily serine protease